jgi:cellulose synthase (UDP-forming)
MRSESTEPFAPLPTSSRRTRISLGSWFQDKPGAVQGIALIAVIAGLVYFTFRIVYTSQGVPLGFFLPLLVAELFGFATFVILIVEAWRVDPTPRPEPLDVPTDVVITTYDEDIDIVEPTIVGALKLTGATTIYLSDDGHRQEMMDLAKLHGIIYHSRRGRSGAKAGNINTILPRLTGDLLLILDADHVPSPDLLDAISGYFRNEKMALVQTAHSFRNHNSVMHAEEGRHEQSLFFDVLLPGRNRLDSVFWCGSAALISRKALLANGGMSTRSVTEDFETSLELQKLGYVIRYHNEHLIQGLAPDNIKAYLIQRFRWARGTLSAFRPGIGLPWSKELSLKQKVSYLGALLYYLTPVQRLVYFGTFVAVGVLGIIPMQYQGPQHLVIWALWIGLSLVAITALNRGTTQPFESTRNMMLSMGVFLRALPALFVAKSFPFQVTPKNQIDSGGWGAISWVLLPIMIAVISGAILAMRWVELAMGDNWPLQGLPNLSPQALIVVTIFGTVEILIVWGFVKALWTRRQDRVLWRFPVQLRAEVAGAPAVCIDLHQAGGGFQAKRSALIGVDEVPIVIETIQVDGKVFLARGVLHIRNRRPIAGNPDAVRVGGVITWSTDRSRVAAIEHCYVVEPFRARNRQWMRRSPRAQVEMPGLLNDAEVTIIDLSIGGAALMISSRDIQVGRAYSLRVGLRNGQTIRAPFTVRNVSETSPGIFRVGGAVDWPETGWLAEYLNLSFAAPRQTAPAFAFSPLM